MGRLVDKRDRRLRRFSRSWKAAVGCKSRCATIFQRFSPGLPISRSGAFQALLLLCGSPDIHRLKQPGYFGHHSVSTLFSVEASIPLLRERQNR
jgi:hypothetical protein